MIDYLTPALTVFNNKSFIENHKHSPEGNFPATVLTIVDYIQGNIDDVVGLLFGVDSSSLKYIFLTFQYVL